MARPIKETPVLYGKDTDRFLRDVRNNLRRDHTESFVRAKAVYDRCTKQAETISHAQVVSR